jgi:hypothetical protein
LKRVGIAVAAALLLFSLPLWSQQSAAATEFEQALQKLLNEEDWSPEQIQRLIKEEVDWGQERFQDAELVSVCLVYAKDTDGQIGPYEQARIALTVMTVAREMRALGFSEQQIIRMSLNGTRDALGELAKLREQVRVRAGEDTETGTGELIRSRFQEQLESAMHLEARLMVQSRVREEQNSRPGDLLVPPGPQGPRGSGR